MVLGNSSRLFAGNGYVYDCMVRAQPHDIISLCAEPGMGKTTLLNAALTSFANGGYKTRYVDLQSYLGDEVLQKLREVSSWCRRHTAKNEPVIVALDNYPSCDEADVDSQVELLRRITRDPCTLLLAFCPESELLLDRLGESSRFWSCDLCLYDSDVSDGAIFDEWSHGIPPLVRAVERLHGVQGLLPSLDPGYQEAFVSQVLGCLRPSLIDEERQLRLAMLLLGKGTRGELDEVLERVDDDIWRLLSRDVPLLGADVSKGSFSCVGNSTADALTASFGSLCELASPWPRLVARCATLLARRGEYVRSAVASLLCSDSRERASVALRACCEFCNVGEADVVANALASARDGGMVGLAGVGDAANVLFALGYDEVVGTPPGIAGEAEASGDYLSEKLGDADLAFVCRDMLQRGPSATELHAFASDDVAHGLEAHARAWTLMAKGLLADAYELILGTPARLESQTVVATLLQMDYVLLSVLNGIVPAQIDLEAFERSRGFLERAGLAMLLSAHEAVVPVACLLVGRRETDFPLEAHLQRASRRGLTYLQGLYLLVLVVQDLRMRALKRAHVRILQARAIFAKANAEELESVAQLLFLAIQYQMGEHVSRPDVLACKGPNKAFNRVLTVFLAAISPDKRSRPVGAGRWSEPGCPRDIHWLVNVLSKDCGTLSKRIREVMPPSWKDSVTRVSMDMDLFFEQEMPSMSRMANGSPRGGTLQYEEGEEGEDKVPIEVTMLGGFEIRANGVPLKASCLERRRAKSLFSLLAAVPGHAVKRFTIMESVWPEYDYGTAMHCVYAATSVVRAELGAALGNDGVPLVVSNKAQGTLGLDEGNVRCDVDLFETVARKVLDSQGDDRLVITLCREVENLYKGDLFVPPTDGRGLVETRARELRALFADVMVAGSYAANNLGMRMLACRFARKAHEIDELREDAVLALVEALCAAGRHVEAEHHFEGFVSRVVDVTRRPPSRHLRETVHGLLQGVALAMGDEPRDANDELDGHVLIVEAHAEDRSGQLKLLFDANEEPGDLDADEVA